MESAAVGEGRPIGLGWALASIATLIGLLAWVIIGLEGSGHIPLILAACVAALIARAHGWRWPVIRSGVVEAIKLAMGATLILVIIGALMGTWMASGTVPALIDWGLWLMRPSFFLPATCLVCAVVSLVSGSSWSTAGTVGVAIMGVGAAMEVNPAMTAGAVISGAYFGDKLSPLSDTTNLAPAMAGTDLFTHIRHMVWTTGPSLVVALVAFSVLGLGFDATAEPEDIAIYRQILQAKYQPSVFHLLAPATVLGLVLLKQPALPTLILATLVGGILALVLYGHSPAEVLGFAMDGYKGATGNEKLDDLLTRGGMNSMMGTVLLIFCAMSFGGVMERTGQLRVVADSALRRAKTSGSLIATTILTSIGVNVLAADQYLSVVVPGRMYAEAYAKAGLHPKNLSRALEDGGTITSPLIPWNTCGAYMATTLGVATGAYLPYCFLNLLNPLIGMFYGFTGFTVAPAEKTPPESAA